MLLWILILFAILQGLLEWLPVSSQGQTVNLLTLIFGKELGESTTIALWLHLGTLLAVLIKYRREILEYLDFRKKDEEIVHWRWFILLSTLGTIVTGIPCYLLLDLIDSEVLVGVYVNLMIGIALLITAVILFLSSKVEEENTQRILVLSKSKMLIAGFLQGFSIIPGISRSGITMGGLLIMRTEKQDALKGSFLMSIPAVLGGFLLDLLFQIVKDEPVLTINWWYMLLAIIVAAIVGYVTIEALLQVARKYNFALVCLILGLIIITFFLVMILL